MFTDSAQVFAKQGEEDASSVELTIEGAREALKVYKILILKICFICD